MFTNHSETTRRLMLLTAWHHSCSVYVCQPINARLNAHQRFRNDHIACAIPVQSVHVDRLMLLQFSNHFQMTVPAVDDRTNSRCTIYTSRIDQCSNQTKRYVTNDCSKRRHCHHSLHTPIPTLSCFCNSKSTSECPPLVATIMHVSPA